MVLPSPRRWDNGGHLCSEALQTAQTGMRSRGGIHQCLSDEVSQVKPRPRQTQKNSVVQSKVKLDVPTKDFHLIILMTDHCGLLKWGGPTVPSLEPASQLGLRQGGPYGNFFLCWSEFDFLIGPGKSGHITNILSTVIGSQKPLYNLLNLIKWSLLAGPLVDWVQGSNWRIARCMRIYILKGKHTVCHLIPYV